MNLLLARILFIFMMDKEKLVVLIWIHDIEALVLRKKHLNPRFCQKSKYILKTIRTSLVARIQFLFKTSQDKCAVPIGIHNIEALVSRKKPFKPFVQLGIKVRPYHLIFSRFTINKAQCTLQMPHFVRTTVFTFILGLRPICGEVRFWVSNLVLVLVFFIYLFCQVFESLCVSYLFHVNCRFMSNCYLCLNVFSSNHVVSYCSMSLVLIFVYVKCHFILINHVF